MREWEKEMGLEECERSEKERRKAGQWWCRREEQRHHTRGRVPKRKGICVSHPLTHELTRASNGTK
jgi:hypothetical protein